MVHPLLQVDRLVKHFPVTRGILLEREVGRVKAVDGIDLRLGHGETIGLVGESGCGKTTFGMMILLLERPTSGRIVFDGKDIWHLSHREIKDLRRSIQAVFQDPLASLNPRMRVGDIIAEPLLVHNLMSQRDAAQRASNLLELVGLKASAMRDFPHEFSGGQRQRIGLARALSLSPQLIVLDEPVSALDVSVRSQVLNLLSDIQAEFGLSYLLISHDLAVVEHMSNRLAVMYLGKFVEVGAGEEVYSHPVHPYTLALLSAHLPPDPEARRFEVHLEGEVPSPLNVPPGCRFHPRCSRRAPICSEEEPALREISPSHEVACHLVA